MTIIVHLGAPRTGTTVLQKHLLPKARRNIIYSKRAYNPSGIATNQEKSSFKSNIQETNDMLAAAQRDISQISPITFTTELLVKNSIIASNKKGGSSDNFRALYMAVNLLKELSRDKGKPILISSERFGDTTASLFGYSSHRWSDRLMPWERLCEAISYGNNISPKITLCLRSPIPYLRSKYIRTFKQRRLMKGERDLSPAEFIQKQSILEINHPGTSALTPAMHAEFIKQLQQHAYVKAFGFQELLASDDAFSLMGLQGEDNYAFREFPRENKLPFSKEQEQAIEIEITKALKRYDFYDRIMKAQMFE